MLKNKGYYRHVEFDEEAGFIRGEVVDLRDAIKFQGKSLNEYISEKLSLTKYT